MDKELIIKNILMEYMEIFKKELDLPSTSFDDYDAAYLATSIMTGLEEAETQDFEEFMRWQEKQSEYQYDKDAQNGQD